MTTQDTSCQFNFKEKFDEVNQRLTSLETWQGRNLGPKLSLSEEYSSSSASNSSSAALSLYEKKFQGQGNEGGGNLDFLQLKTEKEKISKENELLKGQIAKLTYRVSHLIRSLDEAESKIAR